MVWGLNPGGGETFRTHPDRTQPPVRWLLDLFPSSKAARVWHWPLAHIWHWG